MLQYDFFYDDGYRAEVIRVEAPYGPLTHYFVSDVGGPSWAQDVINTLQSVVNGSVPHVSMNGNAWFLEIGPETTRMGDMYATPPIEFDISTKTLIALHEAFRDRKLATRAQTARKQDGG